MDIADVCGLERRMKSYDSADCEIEYIAMFWDLGLGSEDGHVRRRG